MLGLLSCSNNSKNESPAVMPEAVKTNDDLTRKSDAQFLVRAAEFNYKGILIGKLARQRAVDPLVVDLAVMMEDAHRNAKSSLSSLAIMKNMTIPGSPAESAILIYEQLNEKSIEDFDLAYSELTAEDHKQAIVFFEQVVSGNHNPDIQTWAAAQLPILKAHLSRAEVCVSHLSPLSELVR
jgi:putative membrane protein